MFSKFQLDDLRGVEDSWDTNDYQQTVCSLTECLMCPVSLISILGSI